METHTLDTLGLNCPQPVLKIALKAPEMKAGEILEVLGDCATFEQDVRNWCDRLGKIVMAVKEDGPRKKILIRF